MVPGVDTVKQHGEQAEQARARKVVHRYHPPSSARARSQLRRCRSILPNLSDWAQQGKRCRRVSRRGGVGEAGGACGCLTIRAQLRYAWSNPSARRDQRMNASECVLYSGGLKGAEAAFGAAAERHGVEEINFTFDGHRIERSRGVRTLSHAELLQGDVSLAYVGTLMHRRYPNTDTFRHVLQTIWHQVNNAQEIYVVGKILDDGTVKGGTGWGAEFAKLCNKSLHAFDQEHGTWAHWNGSAWEKAPAPVIQHAHFCGTGTRYLEENGKSAIDKLFADSFS
jgi:hypothetical protein